MLELNAVQKRKYPDVKVGDHVRVYKKKDKLDKERISVWSKPKYEVEDIKEETKGNKTNPLLTVFIKLRLVLFFIFYY